jgi:hypothetical protein
MVKSLYCHLELVFMVFDQSSGSSLIYVTGIPVGADVRFFYYL